MTLETAEEFSERSQITQLKARTFKVAIEAGERCSKCRQPATARVGDSYFCSLDAHIARNRARRAKFGSPRR
jgi:hypothetical protein